MSAFYLSSANTNMGSSEGFLWCLNHAADRGRWRVTGFGDFCDSGFAVVDDFGNLVEVER
jgi:hypothetical protein